MSTTLTACALATREVVKRAGCSGGRVTVFFSTYPDYPPTLQRVGKGGKILKHRKNKKAYGNRRVVVGKRWLQVYAPELWAAFMAARLVEGPDAPLPLSLPYRGEPK